MDIYRFNLANPWRTGKEWDVPAIKRSVLADIISWIDEPEVLILLGARQVGKTSILYQMIDYLINNHVPAEDIYFFNLDLAGFKEFFENQSDFIKFINPERKRKAYIFIDEVQRINSPGVFIKAINDLQLPFKFILTGSSSLDIKEKTREPLTGRKNIFHVYPLSFKEYVDCVRNFSEEVSITKDNFSFYLHELNDYLKQFMLFGGYPSVVLSREIEKKHQRMEEIYTSYLEKDIAGYLGITHLEEFRKLVIFLAMQQGNIVNIHELSNSLGIHRSTVEKYIYYLENTFVVDRVTPFFENRRTELSKMPKIYFIDSGIRNFAVGHYSGADNRADFGIVLEGITARYLNQNRVFNQRVHFWRTKSGAEVDFLIVDEKPETSIEVKSKIFKDVNISRGYRSFLQKYQPSTAVLLNQDLWTEKSFEGVKVEMIPSSVYLYSK